MGRLTPYLGVAWAALGFFFWWDAYQTSMRLEWLLGGACLVLALGNVVMARRAKNLR